MIFCFPSFEIHILLIVLGWDAVFGYVTAHLLSAGEQLQTISDFQRPALSKKDRFVADVTTQQPCRLLEQRVGPVFYNRGEIFQVVLMDRVPRSIIDVILLFSMLNCNLDTCSRVSDLLWSGKLLNGFKSCFLYVFHGQCHWQEMLDALHFGIYQLWSQQDGADKQV